MNRLLRFMRNALMFQGEQKGGVRTDSDMGGSQNCEGVIKVPRPYAPLAFANEFIVLSGAGGVEHMKLQKLVYIAYGWWLSSYDDPVLNEAPEVWKHGPVFQSLYRILKEHGRSPICVPQRAMFNRIPSRVDDNDYEVLPLISWVWEKYRNLSSFALSDMTHEAGSPWQKTAAEYGYSVPFHTPISLDLIKEHYRNLARELSGEKTVGFEN